MTTSTTDKRKRDLIAFFSSRSSDMVGVSRRFSRSHGVAARFRDYGCKGKVYAITRVDGHGYPGFKSCQGVPDPINFAYLFVPAEVTLHAPTYAADAGIRHVSNLTSGFAETAEAGAAMPQQILAVEAPIRNLDLPPELEQAAAAPPEVETSYAGPSRIETYTVNYGRDGGAEHATVIARTPQSKRHLARVTDAAMLAALRAPAAEAIGRASAARA